jgi:hypothetical protein
VLWKHEIREWTKLSCASGSINCALGRCAELLPTTATVFWTEKERSEECCLSCLQNIYSGRNEFLSCCYRPLLLCCVIVIRCVCSTCSRDSRTIHTVYSRLELLTFAHFSVCSLFSRRWEQAAGKQSSSLLVDFCALFINFKACRYSPVKWYWCGMKSS